MVTTNPLETDFHFTSTENNNAESDIVNQKISKEEDTRCLRKRMDLKHNDSFNEVDENNTPDSIEHNNATEPCPALKSVSTESKNEHKIPPTKKWREQKKDSEFTSSMPPSKSDLTVNDAIDVLATKTNWIRAELFLSPPDDVSCSGKDSPDEDDPQLSNFKNKLIAQWQLRITQNNGDERVEIDDNSLEVDSTSAPASPFSNDWKHSEGENAKQHLFR